MISNKYMYTNVKQDYNNNKIDICELKIQLPSDKILTVEGTFQTKTKTMSLICFTLFYPDGTEFYNPAVQSTIDLKENYVHLDTIEVPDDLRNIGLGSILFQEWIISVCKILHLKDLKINRIVGEIGEGMNYTPKYSTKLYHKFNNHQINDKKVLKLLKCDRNPNGADIRELEYVIEDIH